MMGTLTYANIEDKLTACFLDYWQDRTPVVLKNDLPKEMPETTPAWIHYTVDKTASRQDSYGADTYRRFLRVGRVCVGVFVLSATITSLQNELVCSVVDYYEKTSQSPLRVLQVSIEDLPDGAHRRASITGDGRWYGTEISVKWAFDEIK